MIRVYEKLFSRPEKTISEIINGKTSITPESATQFEQVLGVPTEFWLKLEFDYQTTKAQLKTKANIESQYAELTEFPYAEMAKWGWVAATRKKDEKVEELLRFFGVVFLKNIRTIESATFRKSRKRKASPQALSAWLRKGELNAQRIDTKPYNRTAFVEAIDDVRGLTRINIGTATENLKGLFAECGVALVFVPHLSKTYANGAARWLSPDKALVQLSIRNRHEDIFWFTLLHECAHILQNRKKH